MNVRWSNEARREVDDAARFYQKKQQGLEQRFLDTLEEAVHRIQRRPMLYPKIEREIHKCKLPRFPYGIIYRTKPETVEILAIMHLKREPGYWKKRSG
jgi:plasmid stabilization system protein ParE